MKAIWQTRMPGYSATGRRFKLLISRVIVPENPGPTNPAVEWTMMPRRPRELLPSTLTTRSSGTVIVSCVTPSANSPGCTMKDSPSFTVIVRMLLRKLSGFLGSRTANRLCSYTLKICPRCKSMEEAWMCCPRFSPVGGVTFTRPDAIAALMSLSERIIGPIVHYKFSSVPLQEQPPSPYDRYPCQRLEPAEGAPSKIIGGRFRQDSQEAAKTPISGSYVPHSRNTCG